MKSHNLIFLLILGIFFACQSTNKEETKESASNNMQESIEESEPKNQKKVILFFGNSLTAGYGLDPSESFPSLIQNRIDSLGLNYNVVNAGLSGETTAGGAGRIDWVLNQQVDVFVLELGGNDMLRGLNIDETERNLRQILSQVRSSKPEAKLIVAGMQAPPNMGKEYTTRFESIYKELSSEFDAGLIPFFLKNVGGIKSLNLPDGIHPNAEGQKIVRENVWEVLKDFLS